ncbi:CsbD family protein [Sphingosinicella sp.]|uniref:CsbD family protein n=1 Tax=Sphingosinicella sp. TaxID=1917971 RepID=UPI00403812F2
MGELTDKVKGTANEAIGKVKQQSEDPATKAEGEAQETKGDFQKAKGEVKGLFGDKL